MSTAAAPHFSSFPPLPPSDLPQFQRRHPSIRTQQLPPPPSTLTYSPLSSGLPSPSFPSPIPLPRGRSPTPASATSSRQPSRQISVRRLSSVFTDYHHYIPRSFDILEPGDIIGQGDNLHGEPINLVHIPSSAPRHGEHPPATHFEVVRKLGAGTYATVYSAKEILSKTLVSNESVPHGQEAREDNAVSCMRKTYIYQYGREFAVKCLSKANLSPEELDVQMFEATLHQSLPTHPNIATLYRTLQTPSYLLLVLESVPGEDLFYFLEQSRDHLDTRENPSAYDDVTSPTATVSHTPPTPSLLSTLHPHHLLSLQRLKLITSMFSQMCDAVAACHERGVSHRDIKPENFIVTEGNDARGERKVVVKLTDFGLATLQKESVDVDCGSAPYMSYGPSLPIPYPHMV